MWVAVWSRFAKRRATESTARVVAAVLCMCSRLAAALADVWKLDCARLSELGYRGRDLVLREVAMLAVCTAGYVCLESYYSAEHDIKIYDFSVYWIRLIEDGQLIGQSIPGYLARLLTSFSEEYTRLAVFPLIPASYILGLEFRDYCFAIFSVYYLPACFFLTILALRLSAAARNVKPGPAAFAVCFCLCAFGVALLWPVMRGYLDVSGVLLAAVMLNYTLHWNGVDFDWKRNVALALLSFLLLFTRRWYAYYIVGFYFSFGLASLADMVLNRNFSVKKLGLLLLNMVMIAALACVAIS